MSHFLFKGTNLILNWGEGPTLFVLHHIFLNLFLWRRPQTLWPCPSRSSLTSRWSWPCGTSTSTTVPPQWRNGKTRRECCTSSVSSALSLSTKSAGDGEHSAGWQPWCECIAACHQMRDQDSFCKLWCMPVWVQPLAFFSPCTVYYSAEEIAWVSLFINQKTEVNLMFFSRPSLSPPPFFPHKFLSCQGTCDERVLLMWSCRDPFGCQQLIYLF